MNHALTALESLCVRQRTHAPIVSTRVPHGRRLEFLPLHFGVHLMNSVQADVFDWMECLSPARPGGLWHFMETSNGGGYLVPAWADRLPVRQPSSGLEQVMSADAAGLTATVLGLQQSIWRGHESLLLKLAQLMAFVEQHPERTKIKLAIVQEEVLC